MVIHFLEAKLCPLSPTCTSIQAPRIASRHAPGLRNPCQTPVTTNSIHWNKFYPSITGAILLILFMPAGAPDPLMLLMSMFPHVYAQVFSTWCSGGAPSTRRTTSNSPTSTAFLRWTSLKMSRDRIPLVGIFSGLEGVVVDVLFNPKARFLGSRIEGGGIDSSIPKRGVWLQIAGSQPEHQLLWTTFCWQIASNRDIWILICICSFCWENTFKKNILNGDEHHRFPFVKGTKSYTIPLSCNRASECHL